MTKTTLFQKFIFNKRKMRILDYMLIWGKDYRLTINDLETEYNLDNKIKPITAEEVVEECNELIKQGILTRWINPKTKVFSYKLSHSQLALALLDVQNGIIRDAFDRKIWKNDKNNKTRKKTSNTKKTQTFKKRFCKDKTRKN